MLNRKYEKITLYNLGRVLRFLSLIAMLNKILHRFRGLIPKFLLHIRDISKYYTVFDNIYNLSQHFKLQHTSRLMQINVIFTS